jgi:hypothetical protein
MRGCEIDIYNGETEVIYTHNTRRNKLISFLLQISGEDEEGRKPINGNQGGLQREVSESSPTYLFILM